MGYYTDLHCKAIIKPEHRAAIQKIVFENSSWKEYFTHDFVELQRADLIPFGDAKLKPSEIFDGTNLHIECSIKNYYSEIEHFFEMLKELSEVISEYKSYGENDFECVDVGDDAIQVQSWYNHLTGLIEEVEVIL